MTSNVDEIALLGSIPAGAADERDPESARVEFDGMRFEASRNTFALRVSGDGMIGRHICDGDFVVLEHRAEPRHGQIVAALVGRKSRVMTYVVRNGSAFLKAENPKYPDLLPADDLVIQGVVRALVRRTRD